MKVDYIAKIAQALNDVSGNGFNYDWTVSIEHSSRKGVYIRARSAYDIMDENGYYDDTIPFVVKVYDDESFDVLFSYKSRDKYLARKYDLRNYIGFTLAEVFADALTE
jgi:hypothetical protein